MHKSFPISVSVIINAKKSVSSVSTELTYIFGHMLITTTSFKLTDYYNSFKIQMVQFATLGG